MIARFINESKQVLVPKFPQILLTLIGSDDSIIFVDRFSEQSAASLQASFRRNSRCSRDEDGIPDELSVREEAEDYEPPYQPLCRIGAGIVEFNFSTVKKYLEAIKAHKAVCAFCRGEAKKTMQIERGIERKAPTGKVA